MTLPAEDIKEINQKLDLIINALGLGDKHRLAPVEIEEKAKNIVLQFQRKNNNDRNHERQKGS